MSYSSYEQYIQDYYPSTIEGDADKQRENKGRYCLLPEKKDELRRKISKAVN